MPDARVSSRLTVSQTGLAFCGGQPDACDFESDAPESDDTQAYRPRAV
jgi:hypothetical protein